MSASALTPSHDAIPSSSKRNFVVLATLMAVSVLALVAVLGLRSGSDDGGAPPELVSLWNGGFDSPNFGGYLDAPWNYEGNGAPEQVRQPVLSGRYAAAFSLNGGDRRQELVASANGEAIKFREGDDLYFDFSTRFASDWPVARTWQLITQWKADGSGSPPIAMIAGSWNADRIAIAAAGWPGGGSDEVHDLGPLVRGRWIDWIVRIKFSSDPTKAKVQVWRDRERVLSLEAWRPSFDGERAGSQGGTLRPGKASYLKTGIYRDPAITETARMWMDRWSIAKGR